MPLIDVQKLYARLSVATEFLKTGLISNGASSMYNELHNQRRFIGLYDNVRKLEDEVTRWNIGNALKQTGIVNGQKIRALDLGCGPGQGYYFLEDEVRNLAWEGAVPDGTSPERNTEYVGIDIDKNMVKAANRVFAEHPHVGFLRGDLRRGIHSLKSSAEDPFDFVFTTYGLPSYLTKDQLEGLFVNLHKSNHLNDGAIVQLDFLGRNSLEWFHEMRDSEDEMFKYSMGYVPGDNGKHPSMRYWTNTEVHDFANELSQKIDGTVEVLFTFDRSMLFGRHMETDTYAKHQPFPPIRTELNRMLAVDQLAEPSRLIVPLGVVPPGYGDVHPGIDDLIGQWNGLARFSTDALAGHRVRLQDYGGFDDGMLTNANRIARAINVKQGLNGSWHGNPRAAIGEPMLAHLFKELEATNQNGNGNGHGLIAILKFNKAISGRAVREREVFN